MEILSSLIEAKTIQEVDRIYNYYLEKLPENQRPRLQEIVRRRKDFIDPNWDKSNTLPRKYSNTKKI
jgi:hypothetical protein